MKAYSIGLLAGALGLVTGCVASEEQQEFQRGVEEPSGQDGPQFIQPYPEGPYGTGIGATIANLEFIGWRTPDVAKYDPALVERMQLGDYHDPKGTRGVKLIVINSSAVWCTACRAEAREIQNEGLFEKYLPQGVVFFWTLFEDNDENPARFQDLVNWATLYEVNYPFVLDPGFKLRFFYDVDATPANIVVDAKTMTIEAEVSGYSPELWTKVDSLLQ